MIFDGHAYCFPSLRGAGGFADPDEFRRHLQKSIGTHHQPVWRSRDRDPGDNSQLTDQANWPSLGALKETQFHAASFGRFEWTYNGEVYAKQYIPPSVEDMSYPAERLVAEMDYAGVDKCLLHRCAFLGTGNDFVADCVRRFPDRLLGLAQVEEWLIEADPDAATDKVEKAVRQQGLSGLQFIPPDLNLYDNRGPWDGPGFLPFWDGVDKLNIPVYLTLMPREDPLWESYHEELKTLQRWMERYPDVTVVHTHGFPWRQFIDGDGLKFPEEVWEPFDNPNLYMQLLFPITLGNVWDYPMPQVRPTIEECVKRIGADRLMWGTDLPMVLRFWTYQQNIDFIRVYCDFLSQQEKDAILGGTAARLHLVP